MADSGYELCPFDFKVCALSINHVISGYGDISNTIKILRKYSMVKLYIVWLSVCVCVCVEVIQCEAE